MISCSDSDDDSGGGGTGGGTGSQTKTYDLSKMSASELGAVDGKAVKEIPGCTELTFPDGAAKWVVDGSKVALKLTGDKKENAIKITVSEERELKISGNLTKDDIRLDDSDGKEQPMYEIPSPNRAIDYNSALAFAYRVRAGVYYLYCKNGADVDIHQFILAAVNAFITGDMKPVNGSSGSTENPGEDKPSTGGDDNPSGVSVSDPITIGGTQIPKTEMVTVIAQGESATITGSADYAANYVITLGDGDHTKTVEGVFVEGRTVTLTGGYEIGKYEVTNELIEAVMGRGSSGLGYQYSGHKQYPYWSASWARAIVFCNKLTLKSGMTTDDLCYSAKNSKGEEIDWEKMTFDHADSWEDIFDRATIDLTKKGWRLPTEAEWEFAARGGSKTYGTDAFKYKYAGTDAADKLDEYAHRGSALDPNPLPVGSKKPNALGIYDMTGNAWELCSDRYGATIREESVTNPTGEEGSGFNRVKRGGSSAQDITRRDYEYLLAYRAGDDGVCGFRLARSKEIPVEKVEISGGAAEIEVSETTVLTATVTPGNASSRNVKWSSSDEKVATVDGGNVIGVAEGKVTITATAGEKSVSKEITVTPFAGVTVADKQIAKTEMVTVIPKGSSATITGSADYAYPDKDYKGVFIEGRTVTLAGYEIGKFEVTQELFEAVMGKNPSKFTADAAAGETQKYRPVEQVSRYAAIAFCNKLTLMTGGTTDDLCYSIKVDDSEIDWENLTYTDIPIAGTSGLNSWEKATLDLTKKGWRLPTEAEWEFAARGGDTSKNAFKYKYAGTNDDGNLADYAWCKSNADKKTHQVGKKTANALGLYDMSGNVQEWCWDLYSNKIETGEVTNPVGFDYSLWISSYVCDAVIRGGSYYDEDASSYAVAKRGHFVHTETHFNWGFRVARTLK